MALPFDATCDLCEAARISPWHAEDDICWVADCEVCDVPMVVWRQHGTDPGEDDRRHMIDLLETVADRRHTIDLLETVADRRLGAGEWFLDDVMRQIPDHFHAHARGRRHPAFGG